MANEPENRMLFDLRGRRKRVIQVIYVMLAFVMAASLLVIGLPGGINPFGGSGAISQDAAELSIERAERLETRIAEQPGNRNAKAELVRARVAAGNSLVVLDENGQQTVGPEAKAQYDLAATAWERYVRSTGGEPDPSVAQLMATTLFTLAQGATVSQFEGNISDAARAQQFVADAATKAFRREEGPAPTGALVTLATYQYYAQQFARADANRVRALASTRDDGERKQIENQLDAIEKEARQVGKTIRQAKKQAAENPGQSLEQPLGGFGGGSAPGAPEGQP